MDTVPSLLRTSADRHKGRKIVRGDADGHAEPMCDEVAVLDPATDSSG
jgi:hypothetical protein